MGEEFFKLEYLLAFPAYVLILLAAIVLHEMGHFIAARVFNIPIQDVVIGRGKLLKSRQSKANINWQLRIWPIGAHVHLQDIESRPFHQKIITILAGPLINFVSVPFLFFAFYCAVGQPAVPNRVVAVEEGLPAYEAGIRPGDEFIAVDNIPLTNHDDIWRHVYTRGEVESQFTIKRGEKIFNVSIKPGWVEYQDLRGLQRKNARFGVMWQHAPFSIKSIETINGIDTKDDAELARSLLIENFDKTITINIETPLEKQNPFHVFLKGKLNQDLLDEDEKFYDSVFLGASGNTYMQSTLFENAKKAYRYASELFINLAKLPFQIFPIDKTKLQDEAAVYNEDTNIANRLYSLIHLFAVASIAIGLINLLPFPNLDGGQLIDQILKKIRKNDVSNKLRANVFVTAFFVLYASIFIANMDNLYGYIDFSFKKVHEWVDQKNND